MTASFLSSRWVQKDSHAWDMEKSQFQSHSLPPTTSYPSLFLEAIFPLSILGWRVSVYPTSSRLTLGSGTSLVAYGASLLWEGDSGDFPQDPCLHPASTVVCLGVGGCVSSLSQGT